MIVSAVESQRGDGVQELSADVTFERPTARTLRAWFRFPDGGNEGWPIGDPLLAGFLLPAMALEEGLRIDAPVSTALLSAVRERLAPVFGRWGWDRER